MDNIYWITPEFSVALAGLLGLLVGSFLNVVIHRLPLMMQRQWEAELNEALLAQANMDALSHTTGSDTISDEEVPTGHGRGQSQSKAFNLLVPRSRCPHCEHQITALENIPVFSWIFLRGACRECRKPIPVRYPFVELLTGILAASSVWRFGFDLTGLAAALFCCVLITLTFIDYDTQLLPDNLTLPLLWSGLLLNLTRHAMTSLPDAVIGAIAGYLILWCVYWTFKLISGKEGMGYGDFKLLAALGAWFGWQALPAIILISSVLGTIVGVGLILFKNHSRSHPIPFGPYLSGAGLIMLFNGGQVLHWMGMIPVIAHA